MKVQIRDLAGNIMNKEVNNALDLVELFDQKDIEKISFDLFDARLILRTDGTYQIVGILIIHEDIR